MQLDFFSWLNSRDWPLHLVFLGHFVLVSLVYVDANLANAILFPNACLLLLVAWSLQERISASPVLLAFVVDVVSVVIEVIVLFVVHGVVGQSVAQLAALSNLTFRLVSCLLLHRELCGRDDLEAQSPSSRSAALASISSSLDVHNVKQNNNKAAIPPTFVQYN